MTRSRNSKRLTAALLAALLLLASCVSAGTAETGNAGESRTLTAGIVGGTCDLEGVWHIAREEEGKLQIRWNAGVSDTSYTLMLTLPDGEEIYDIVTTAVLLYPEKDLPAGEYKLRITAYTGGMPYTGGTPCGYGFLKFVLEGDAQEQSAAEQPAAEQPAEESAAGEDGQAAAAEPESGNSEAGGTASGNRGNTRPSGGSRGNAAGRTSGRAQTPAVTPGKALTTAHARGSGTLLPYGTVELTVSEAPMEILVLGGEELALDCGGEPFTAVILEDVLILTCEAGSDAWTVTLKALNTLRESGIREIRMTAGETEAVLETDMVFTGSAYARERAQGYVSADFLLCRRDGCWAVTVEDRLYDLTQLTADGQTGDRI